MAPPPPSETPSSKAVSISEDTPETIEIESRRPSHTLRKTLSNKRLHGRLPVSPHLAASITTRDVIPKVSLTGTENMPPSLAEEEHGANGHAHGHGNGHHHVQRVVTGVRGWIEAERTRRRERRRRVHPTHAHDGNGLSDDEALAELEQMLTNAVLRPQGPRKKSSGRRRSLGVSAASDTEYTSDGEAVVPTCEVWLKTPEETGWEVFKAEVLKLSHTLKCKGWRRVDLGRSAEVGVERISGALTNAVYMVTPPADVPASCASSTTSLPLTATPRQPPAPLLLRIYGPQVSHLIDRDTELSILRRLARNHIGPRMLGTFENGRFEQFFTARTLTKADIRLPPTSRHIAKRLKELHTGIDLLSHERAAGPIVWVNWKKWAPRARTVMGGEGSWWPAFETAVDRYRTWLSITRGGDRLVFAHNDTQYGNILRLQASGKSPLLMPENEHRQLVVIDFEYASANTVGFEVANHFCEWMADYHCDTPHVMRKAKYPTESEMRNFLGAYVEHKLGGGIGGGSGGFGGLGSMGGSSTSLLDSGNADSPARWNLDDARTPAPPPSALTHRDEAVEAEVDALLAEAAAWRAAAHAMWCAWGVVQAKTEEGEKDGDGAQEAEEEEEEFDYLEYAKQRAALFWGDVVELGIVKKEEVPEVFADVCSA
ncbi:choline kinase-like protein [Geopyxis carbonaria]|nr:choline kinase-like protein [Geopyxis carbonaria]